MIYLPAALIGAVIGGLNAKRRGGKGLDIAQYAAVYGIAFALLGLIVTIILDRNGVFG
ncbi:apolipoprotein acyltransferase [uncultured Tateyamaria sp.]|uniref:apolipoprotein acyltransferase n=1 Tax=Tateyamaria sp. 1078 TaxID=3417464 RepID=UPI0026289945|nr:apolipoprotein acyltransferase [uncultured Tateyamaria sp.]